MSQSPKPIFCVTHPRACSTAFERVFMARDDLNCVHEPFGEAYYFGPERMGARYENDAEAREASGQSDVTYARVFDQIDKAGSEGKRVFIKDMAYYLVPPDSKQPQVSPSLLQRSREEHINGHANDALDRNLHHDGGPPFPYGTRTEPGNPTVIPEKLLKQFHYTFLIRDPHYSIPSYHKATTPPMNKLTQWNEFYPSEIGYEELRGFFDYLVSIKLVALPDTGSAQNTTHTNGTTGHDTKTPKVCIVDADDLLDSPEATIQAYCAAVGLTYDPAMLHWGEDANMQLNAEQAFEKWKGWHDDALNSTELRPRAHRKAKKTEPEFDAEWAQKYGSKGAALIREHVDANMDAYRYLKQYAVTVDP